MEDSNLAPYIDYTGGWSDWVFYGEPHVYPQYGVERYPYEYTRDGVKFPGHDIVYYEVQEAG